MCEGNEDGIEDMEENYQPFKVGDSFTSFKEVTEIIEKLVDRTNGKFVVHNSKKVVTVNAGLKGQKFNEELEYTNATITCKHYGEVRSRSTGVRPNQSTFKIACPWYVHLIANRKLQKLFVDKVVLEHNHTLSKEVTSYYPENRALNEAEISQVEKLLKLRVKPSILLDLIHKETGKKVIGQDIANLGQAIEARERGGLTETEFLLEYLNEIDQDGDHVVIGTNDENVIQYVFIVLASMVQTFKKFPEVLIMDSTYNTSKNKLPLLIVCAMNGLGITEPIGYAFVVNETKDIIAEVLTQFKQIVGEEDYLKIRTVVIDKDPGEIAAVQAAIPHAYIQLCTFHVLQIFKRETKGQPNIINVREILQKMVYAQSDVEYNNLCDSLKCIASEELFEYFNDNWHNCPQAWTRKHKLESPNLGNDTSNRVESFNQKIKAIVDRSGTIKAAIEDIRLLLRNKENQIGFKRYLMCAKKSYVANCNIPEVQEALNDCTLFAAAYIRAELEESRKQAVKIIYETTTTSCTCYVAKSLLLLCRHEMRLREAQGLPKYCKTLVAERWHREYNLPEVQSFPKSTSGVLLNNMPQSIRPKSKSKKYKSALRLGSELAEILSVCGIKTYCKREQFLKNLIMAWKNNESVSLVKLPSSGAVELSADSGPEEENEHDTSGPEKATFDNDQSQEVSDENQENGHVDSIKTERFEAISDTETIIIESSEDEEDLFQSLKLPSPVKAKGRPVGDKRRLTAIGNVRKPKMNFSQKLKLPAAPKIIGKPREYQRTTHTYNKRSKNKRQRVQKTAVNSGTSEDEDGNLAPINTQLNPDNHITDSEEEKDKEHPLMSQPPTTTLSKQLQQTHDKDKEEPALDRSPASPVLGSQASNAMNRKMRLMKSSGTEMPTKQCFNCKCDLVITSAKGPKNAGRKYYRCPEKREGCKGFNMNGFIIWAEKKESQSPKPNWEKQGTKQLDIKRLLSESTDILEGEKMLQTFINLESRAEAPLGTIAIVESNPMACCVCKVGEPKHLCVICTKPVHTLPNCSEPNDGAEEGYRQARKCKNCLGPSKTQKKSGVKRKLYPQEGLDTILPSSQVSSSGRTITRKYPYTPPAK